MNECAQNRRGVANDFKKYRKVFIALGDETRQHIFIALLENEKIGMRVPEITKRTHLSRPAVSHQIQAKGTGHGYRCSTAGLVCSGSGSSLAGSHCYESAKI